MKDKTWRLRFWFWLTISANITSPLMQRYGLEQGWKWGTRGCALHINEQSWASRLNRWVSKHWVDEWIVRSLARQEVSISCR